MDYKSAYENLPDNDLIDLAKDAKNLVPEAYESLHSVLLQRDLFLIISKKSFLAAKPLSSVELDLLVKEFKKGICPICNENTIDDAVETTRNIGVIIKSLFYSEMNIGCFGCLKEAVIGDTLFTLLVGWWSIPGLFITPYHLIFNLIKLRKINRRIPTDTLRKYVRDNRDVLIQKQSISDTSKDDNLTFKDSDLENFSMKILEDRLEKYGAKWLFMNYKAMDDLDREEQQRIILTYAKEYDFDLDVYSKDDINQFITQYVEFEEFSILYDSVHGWALAVRPPRDENE